MACFAKKPKCGGPLAEDQSGLCPACLDLFKTCGDLLSTKKKNIRERRGSIIMLGLNEATGKELQTAWSTRLDRLVQSLFHDALVVVTKDPPQTGWCFCVSGSGARQEACPYSDLDCFILVDDASPNTADIYRRAAKTMSDFLFALDEDGTLDLGLRFCHGGLNPLGYNTQSQPELIGMPSRIASFIEEKGVNEHIVTGLAESRAVCGDDSLHDIYRKEVEEVRGKSLSAPWSRPTLPGNKKAGLKLIEKAAKGWKGGLTKDTKQVDIKMDVYRVPQYALGGLAMWYDIKEQNSFRIVEELNKKDKLSTRAVCAFNTVLEVVAKLRISAHLVQGGELDTLVPTQQKNATELNETEWKELLGCRFHLDFIARLALQFIENKTSILKKNRTNPFSTSI